MRPFLFLLLAPLPFLAAAEPHTFASGPARIALVELFTSEGCSSCPPAERWLGALRDDPGLWKNFVPVAFHVDYWNRLGWPDRFSAREFTQREYEHAAGWRSGSVYTPCFVRDGAEWRARDGVPASHEEAGALTATLDGGVLRAEFAPAPGASGGRRSAAAEFEIHAALLGASIVSRVTAGENRGETLRHEFVALALVAGAPGADIALAAPRKFTDIPRRALAVWVTRRGSLAPLQACGGWLD